MQAALALGLVCLIKITPDPMHSGYYGFKRMRCFDRGKTPARVDSSEIQAAAIQRPNTIGQAAGSKKLFTMSLIVGLLRSMRPVLLGVAAHLLITRYVSSYKHASPSAHTINFEHILRSAETLKQIVCWGDGQHG